MLLRVRGRLRRSANTATFEAGSSRCRAVDRYAVNALRASPTRPGTVGLLALLASKGSRHGAQGVVAAPAPAEVFPVELGGRRIARTAPRAQPAGYWPRRCRQQQMSTEPRLVRLCQAATRPRRRPSLPNQLRRIIMRRRPRWAARRARRMPRLSASCIFTNPSNTLIADSAAAPQPCFYLHRKNAAAKPPRNR